MKTANNFLIVAFLTIIVSMFCFGSHFAEAGQETKKEFRVIDPSFAYTLRDGFIFSRQPSVSKTFYWTQFVGVSQQDDRRLMKAEYLIIILQFNDGTRMRLWGKTKHREVLMDAFLKPGAPSKYDVFYDKFDRPDKNDADGQFLSYLAKKYPGLNLPRYRIMRIRAKR